MARPDNVLVFKIPSLARLCRCAIGFLAARCGAPLASGT